MCFIVESETRDTNSYPTHTHWKTTCHQCSALKLLCFVFTGLFTSHSDWEPGPLHVLHTREGAVWRRRPEAGGAAPPLVQHGHHAGAARDPRRRQRGDPATGSTESINGALREQCYL